MDISGIQSFIYTIAVDKALKQLRSRSIYLEILMEHLIDELLEMLHLTRANLIYSGGGHCYMILPNTAQAKSALAEFEKESNTWFRRLFDVSLYIGIGYAECSYASLKNAVPGSYAEIFSNVSRMISGKKLHRYSAEEILQLNSRKHHGERECRVCRSTGILNDDGRCPVCAALERFAADVMNYNVFIVTSKKISDNALALPFGRYLTARSDNAARAMMDSSPDYVRTYVKNNLHMGKSVAQNLWIGDYSYAKEFEELGNASQGVRKIAVLRADVDNLGNTFVNGFKRGQDSRYETLTRSAVLSRQLSLFFKGYINTILREASLKEMSISGKSAPMAVTIVYSGGDDVFLVGAWNSVLDAFIVLKDALKKFSQGTLTLSGGIGIYDHSFPINVMAEEVAELEDCSKSVDGKNAITCFSAENCYSWDIFTGKVLSEKLALLRGFADCTSGYGNSFLYNILELLRNSSEKINLARLAYLLSRLEPNERTAGAEAVKRYSEFAKNVYTWAQSESDSDRRQFISALLIFVYLNRCEVD